MYNDAHMELVKKGIYRIDSDPGKLRVYDGEVRVTAGNQTLVARKGREVLLGAVLDMNGFDVKDTDAFMRWAARRSEYLAQANVSAARTASGLGYSGSSYGSGYGYGSGMLGGGMMGGGMMGGNWAYNPFYGMFTYMPYGNGMYYSPFGYPFYSPTNVGYYMPSGFTGSAFPLSASGTSPHYNGSGTGTIAPRGSYGSTNGGAATSAARGSSALSSAGSGSGGMSNGGMSSGAAGHAGGGGRGK
jgi:hypothetical protein